jgi:outer membrane receptor for ferrienterochelin and colicin
VQGFESISGQINVETLAPERAKPLFINAYLNSFGEKHINLLHRYKLGSWTALTSLHSVQPAQRIDRDDDSFMDLPLLRRYLVGQQWSYGSKQANGWHSQLGIRWLWENRVGGQLAYQPDRDLGSRQIYGQSVQIQQPEWWTKTGYRFNKNHQLVLLAAAFQQQQDTYFGFVNYQAKQISAYANLQHEWTYNDQHDLKAGVSFRYLNLQEDLGFDNDPLQRTYAGQYQRKDLIPGFFIENTLRLADNRITWIAGLRADDHQQFGLRITPRSLIKYDFSANTTVRASIGTGWRIVNFFSENIALLASSRNLLFTEPLAPEQAVNMGLNLTHKYATDKLSGYLSIDFYRTHFSNQIFPDYDTDPRLAIVQNFRGLSASNGFQADFVIRALERIEFKAGYNYLDVYREQEQIKQELPFNPKHKWISSLSYHPLSNRFQLDANFHRYGKQRLPDTSLNPAAYQRPDQSDAFVIMNLQFTLRFNTLEWYVGCENIFDFRQLRPIISWQDPFGPYFDTSSVWGPTRGREFYVGARYTLTEKD